MISRLFVNHRAFRPTTDIQSFTWIDSATSLEHKFVPVGRPAAEVRSRVLKTNTLSNHYPVWSAICFVAVSPPRPPSLYIAAYLAPLTLIGFSILWLTYMRPVCFLP